MTQFRARLACIGATIATFLGACSDQAIPVRVDKHVFSVPKKHLITGVVPWLPTSQSDGLKFVINPDDPLKEQINVGIGSTSTTCDKRTSTGLSQLDTACSAAREGGKARTTQEFSLAKVHRQGDPTQWEYHLKGDGTVVASCFALSDDRQAGLCTSLGTYKDLVYSVGVRDSDVIHLPEIRSRISNLLNSWEKT